MSGFGDRKHLGIPHSARVKERNGDRERVGFRVQKGSNAPDGAGSKGFK